MPETQSLELQAAVVATLSAATAVSAIVGAAIYDQPPQNAALPYIRIGAIDEEPQRGTDCLDYDYALSIECHSRPISGRVEVARMAGAVRDALDDAHLSGMSVDGSRLAWIKYLGTTTQRASDGRSYLAIVLFSAWLDG